MQPEAVSFVNALGMYMLSIPAGSFQMGQVTGARWHAGGEWDEEPVHAVTISQPFWMSATEVTNAQYEQFDPAHKQRRGERGFSTLDDEAVVFVSWNDAQAFCAWLSQHEGKPYRLPTEAEWEYACRAGSTTPYSTGDTLPSAYWRQQIGYEDDGHFEEHQRPVSLRVGQSPLNAWGLHDMHGNVEEWCLDWYGPYARQPQIDPVGRAAGDARVTRGGSHNTDIYYLRSANRMGAVPEDRHWMIGFRVVQAPPPQGQPLPMIVPPVMQNVSQTIPPGLGAQSVPQVPRFAEPKPYVRGVDSELGPTFAFHNHDPALIDCANGDLLAIWFSTQREWGRELNILGSRLRYGAREWEPASLFFSIPDRNTHAPALWRDRDGTLFHFNAVGASGWEALAIVLRTSTDHGATWTPARFIQPDRGRACGCVQSVIRTQQGSILVPLDAERSTALLASNDGGQTFALLGDDAEQFDCRVGASGSRIAGIHASVVELLNGGLLAIGRGENEGQHPLMSLSNDAGHHWQYEKSPFPRIGAGQRTLLRRLQEGPLLYVGFTDPVTHIDDFKLGVTRRRELGTEGMLIRDAAGRERRVYGLFAALSEDEGLTWPIRKLITPGGAPRTWFGHGWTKDFITDATHAEPLGYLAVTQTPDGMIQLISSGIHYAFNLAWLREPMPAEATQEPAT